MVARGDAVTRFAATAGRNSQGCFSASAAPARNGQGDSAGNRAAQSRAGSANPWSGRHQKIRQRTCSGISAALTAAMKTWQVCLIAIGAFALLGLEALGFLIFGTRTAAQALKPLAAEEQSQNHKLEKLRAQAIAARIYKETAEECSDRGDYDG